MLHHNFPLILDVLQSLLEILDCEALHLYWLFFLKLDLLKYLVAIY